jgi:integral membrane protein (TIGR01906 family)
MMGKTEPRRFALPGWLRGIFTVVIVAGMPLLLVLLNARALMSDAFLRFEYTRPWLPDDPYGFTREDRLEYAPPALGYLFNSEGIEYLGDETFPDGSPLYNERELSHMVDVKNVTRGLSVFGYSLIGVVAVFIVLMALDEGSRPALYQALLSGSVLTAGLILLGIVAVATSFRWLFTQFHAIFFEGESWIFLNSDTLIRLFPMRFWADAFAIMFGGALLEAGVIGVVMWRLLSRRSAKV